MTSCACGEAVNEEVVPVLIYPLAILAVAIPRGCVFLVVPDDAACEMRHSADVGGILYYRNGSRGVIERTNLLAQKRITAVISELQRNEAQAGREGELGRLSAALELDGPKAPIVPVK